MNDKFINDVSLLKEEITSLPLYQEYMKCKTYIDNNEELKKYLKNMHFHQQNMIMKHTNNDVEDYDYIEYHKYYDLYYNNPFVVNYYNYKEEIVSLFNEIKDSLEI